jgi:hypothetical protein
MSDEGTPPSAAPDAPSAALWEDFIDIFYAPSSVFERRRDRSGWLVLVIVTIVLGVLFFAWQRSLGPVMDIEMDRVMADRVAQNPDLGPEQVEQMRSMGRAFGPIGFVLVFPIGVLVTAAVTWGLARLFGAAAAFGTILVVVSYAQVVRVLGFVAGLAQATLLGLDGLDSVHDVGFSLARFLDQPEAGSLAVNLAARVDLFTLWATALIAIGLHVVTRLSKANAWAIAVLVWLLAAIPTLLGGLAGS